MCRHRKAWQPEVGRVAVTTQGILPVSLFIGQEVEITGVAGPPRLATAEGMFDYRAYLKQQGITGWPASAIRATVMLSVVIIGWALRRPSDLINSLFAAALIIIISLF